MATGLMFGPMILCTNQNSMSRISRIQLDVTKAVSSQLMHPVNIVPFALLVWKCVSTAKPLLSISPFNIMTFYLMQVGMEMIAYIMSCELNGKPKLLSLSPMLCWQTIQSDLITDEV